MPNSGPKNQSIGKTLLEELMESVESKMLFHEGVLGGWGYLRIQIWPPGVSLDSPRRASWKEDGKIVRN
jgi:hypothetical protein